jgi:hypothetical protein
MATWSAIVEYHSDEYATSLAKVSEFRPPVSSQGLACVKQSLVKRKYVTHVP